MKKIAKNIEENNEIAEIFLKKILSTKNKGASVVALSGNLGAGKTSFTQSIARELGVKNKVISPTFVIIKKYSLKKGLYKFLFHIDAFRLKNEKELINLGWKEIISNKDHLVFIEWPEIEKKIIPKNSFRVKISHTKEGYRSFVFNK